MDNDWITKQATLYLSEREYEELSYDIEENNYVEYDEYCHEVDFDDGRYIEIAWSTYDEDDDLYVELTLCDPLEGEINTDRVEVTLPEDITDRLRLRDWERRICYDLSVKVKDNSIVLA